MLEVSQRGRKYLEAGLMCFLCLHACCIICHQWGGILCCCCCQQGAARCWFCSRDRLIGDDKELCDENCVAEARVLGLMFSVGRLLHSITQTMQVAAKPFKLGHKTRLLDTAADSVSSSTLSF